MKNYLKNISVRSEKRRPSRAVRQTFLRAYSVAFISTGHVH